MASKTFLSDIAVLGDISAVIVTAYLQGTADNAKKWTTTRTLSLSGDVTGSASIDGSGNVNIAATVVSSGHTHPYLPLAAGSASKLQGDLWFSAYTKRIIFNSNNILTYKTWTANTESELGIVNAGGGDITFKHGTEYGLAIKKAGATVLYYAGANKAETTANGLMSTGLFPYAHNSSDIGTSSARWRKGYFSSTVYAPTFSGSLSGNASTASSAAKLTTARDLKVTLTGDATGTAHATFDGSANWAISIGTSVADIGGILPANIVTKTGTQTITGEKTFSSTWTKFTGSYVQMNTLIVGSIAGDAVFRSAGNPGTSPTLSLRGKNSVSSLVETYKLTPTLTTATAGSEVISTVMSILGNDIVTYGSSTTTPATTVFHSAVQATSFIGNASSASTATKLTTARTFTINGDVNTVTQSFNGTANPTFTLAVKNDSHVHTKIYRVDDRDVKPSVTPKSYMGFYFTSLEGMTGAAGSNYQDMISLNSYQDSSGGLINALAFDKTEKLVRLYQATQNATSWGTPVILATRPNSGGSTAKYMNETGAYTVPPNTTYTHPTHPGDDFSVDTGALSGAVIVSDIDINVTTDTLGHVTDANGVVATRTLTLANLGYTGATNANYYGDWNLYVDGTHKKNVTNANNVKFKKGTGISLSYASDELTITNTSPNVGANNPTITIASGAGLSGGSSFTLNQSAAKTITLVNTAPNVQAKNATVTLTAGGGISGGGTFTADQATNKSITFSHTNTSSQGSVNNSGLKFIQDISLDTYGHITGLVSKTISQSEVESGFVFAGSGTGAMSINAYYILAKMTTDTWQVRLDMHTVSGNASSSVSTITCVSGYVTIDNAARYGSSHAMANLYVRKKTVETVTTYYIRVRAYGVARSIAWSIFENVEGAYGANSITVNSTLGADVASTTAIYDLYLPFYYSKSGDGRNPGSAGSASSANSITTKTTNYYDALPDDSSYRGHFFLWNYSMPENYWLTAAHSATGTTRDILFIKGNDYNGLNGINALAFDKTESGDLRLWQAAEGDTHYIDKGHFALVPLTGSSSKYLNQTGTWTTPPYRAISDSISSTSSTVAASSKAVKTAYDKANHSHPYGTMSIWNIKEGNGTETADVTNGQTVTFAQSTGMEVELTSTTSGGTLTFKNTMPNATHTGDVTGSAALTIGAKKVTIPKLNVTGTASTAKYLRYKDSNTLEWTTPPGTYTITKSDVESVLTGNITSHTHNYVSNVYLGSQSRDPNTITEGVRFGYSSSNKPVGSNTDGSYITSAHSSTWVNQIWQDWRAGGKLYVRSKNSGTWGSWSGIAKERWIAKGSGYGTGTSGWIKLAVVTGSDWKIKIEFDHVLKNTAVPPVQIEWGNVTIYVNAKADSIAGWNEGSTYIGGYGVYHFYVYKDGSNYVFWVDMVGSADRIEYTFFEDSNITPASIAVNSIGVHGSHAGTQKVYLHYIFAYQDFGKSVYSSNSSGSTTGVSIRRTYSDCLPDDTSYRGYITAYSEKRDRFFGSTHPNSGDDVDILLVKGNDYNGFTGINAMMFDKSKAGKVTLMQADEGDTHWMDRGLFEVNKVVEGAGTLGASDTYTTLGNITGPNWEVTINMWATSGSERSFSVVLKCYNNIISYVNNGGAGSTTYLVRYFYVGRLADTYHFRVRSYGARDVAWTITHRVAIGGVLVADSDLQPDVSGTSTKVTLTLPNLYFQKSSSSYLGNVEGTASYATYFNGSGGAKMPNYTGADGRFSHYKTALSALTGDGTDTDVVDMLRPHRTVAGTELIGLAFNHTVGKLQTLKATYMDTTWAKAGDVAILPVSGSTADTTNYVLNGTGTWVNATSLTTGYSYKSVYVGPVHKTPVAAYGNSMSYLQAPYKDFAGGASTTRWMGVITKDNTAGKAGLLAMDGSGNLQLGFASSSAALFSMRTVLTNGNVYSYTVKKDGTGATGTWPISITGSAGSVSIANATGNSEYPVPMLTGGKFYTTSDTRKKLTMNPSTGMVSMHSLTLKGPTASHTLTATNTRIVSSKQFQAPDFVGTLYGQHYGSTGNKTTSQAGEINTRELSFFQSGDTTAHQSVSWDGTYIQMGPKVKASTFYGYFAGTSDYSYRLSPLGESYSKPSHTGWDTRLMTYQTTHNYLTTGTAGGDKYSFMSIKNTGTGEKTVGIGFNQISGKVYLYSATAGDANWVRGGELGAAASSIAYGAVLNTSSGNSDYSVPISSSNRFYHASSSANRLTYNLSNGHVKATGFYPKVDNGGDLGSAALTWSKVYAGTFYGRFSGLSDFTYAQRTDRDPYMAPSNTSYNEYVIWGTPADASTLTTSTSSRFAGKQWTIMYPKTKSGTHVFSMWFDSTGSYKPRMQYAAKASAEWTDLGEIAYTGGTISYTSYWNSVTGTRAANYTGINTRMSHHEIAEKDIIGGTTALNRMHIIRPHSTAAGSKLTSLAFNTTTGATSIYKATYGDALWTKKGDIALLPVSGGAGYNNSQYILNGKGLWVAATTLTVSTSWYAGLITTRGESEGKPSYTSHSTRMKRTNTTMGYLTTGSSGGNSAFLLKNEINTAGKYQTGIAWDTVTGIAYSMRALVGASKWEKGAAFGVHGMEMVQGAGTNGADNTYSSIGYIKGLNWSGKIELRTTTSGGAYAVIDIACIDGNVSAVSSEARYDAPHLLNNLYIGLKDTDKFHIRLKSDGARGLIWRVFLDPTIGGVMHISPTLLSDVSGTSTRASISNPGYYLGSNGARYHASLEGTASYATYLNVAGTNTAPVTYTGVDGRISHTRGSLNTWTGDTLDSSDNVNVLRVHEVATAKKLSALAFNNTSGFIEVLSGVHATGSWSRKGRIGSWIDATRNNSGVPSGENEVFIGNKKGIKFMFNKKFTNTYYELRYHTVTNPLSEGLEIHSSTIWSYTGQTYVYGNLDNPGTNKTVGSGSYPWKQMTAKEFWVSTGAGGSVVKLTASSTHLKIDKKVQIHGDQIRMDNNGTNYFSSIYGSVVFEAPVNKVFSFNKIILAPDFDLSSDARMKENIIPLYSKRLNPVRFDWKKDGKHDIGFIAQEIEVDYPEVVHTGEDGMKSISYSKVTAINAARINELEAKIERLEALINKLI